MEFESSHVFCGVMPKDLRLHPPSSAISQILALLALSQREVGLTTLPAEPRFDELLAAREACAPELFAINPRTASGTTVSWSNGPRAVACRRNKGPDCSSSELIRPLARRHHGIIGKIPA